jgi:hypothetical protein
LDFIKIKNFCVSEFKNTTKTKQNKTKPSSRKVTARHWCLTPVILLRRQRSGRFGSKPALDK